MVRIIFPFEFPGSGVNIILQQHEIIPVQRNQEEDANEIPQGVNNHERGRQDLGRTQYEPFPPRLSYFTLL